MKALVVALALVPPHGLTAYGRLVWNLDALLHDRYGSRQVWVNDAAISTRFVSEAGSRRYLYTWRAAHGSSFRLLRPNRPPRKSIGVAGWEEPLRIGGAYISCARGRWLYEHFGEDPLQWEIDCLPGG
jgi:hypothetical protein